MDVKYIIHVIITVFAFFGWLLSPKIHAPFCGAIVMHWLTNNNRCVLSGEYEDENGFTKELLAYVGIPWPDEKMAQNAIPYALLLIPMAISVILANN
jgi:hypothetical protein